MTLSKSLCSLSFTCFPFEMGKNICLASCLGMRWDHMCQGCSKMAGILLVSCWERLLSGLICKPSKRSLHTELGTPFSGDPSQEHAPWVVSIGKFISAKWRAEEKAHQQESSRHSPSLQGLNKEATAFALECFCHPLLMWNLFICSKASEVRFHRTHWDLC